MPFHGRKEKKTRILLTDSMPRLPAEHVNMARSATLPIQIPCQVTTNSTTERATDFGFLNGMPLQLLCRVHAEASQQDLP